MRVFVAGATGVVGQYLVPSLVAAGHEVTGTTRSTAKAATLQAAGATPVIVDGLDRQAVLDAVKAAQPEVIVHQMTALASMSSFRNFDKEFAVTNELRTKGTDYLLEAAQQAGTRRFIAQSFVGWNNARTGGPVKTEEDPLDPDPVPSTRQVHGGDQARRGDRARRGARGPGAALRLLLRPRRLGQHARRGAQAADARHRRGRGHLVVLRDHRRRRRDRRGRQPRRARHLQHRRRRPGPGAGVAAVPGRVPRRQGAHARPGLAGRAAGRPARRLADDPGPRLGQREGQAGTRLGAQYASWRDGFRDWAKTAEQGRAA